MTKVLVLIVTVYVRWAQNPSVGYLSFRSNLIGSPYVMHSLTFPYRNIGIALFQEVKFRPKFDFKFGLGDDVDNYCLSYTLHCTHWNIFCVTQQNACCEAADTFVG